MKFFYYSSVISLIAALTLALIGFYTSDLWFIILCLQFALGWFHFISTLDAFYKYGMKRNWFLVHLLICMFYLALWAMGSYGVPMNKELLITVVFVIPWPIAIVHTYQLYKTLPAKKIRAIDI